jgi:hypothetical protein
MNTGNPIIDNITIQDFKDEFYRGFNYVDNWIASSEYNTNDKVFYLVNKKFYQCLKNNITTIPTISADWMQLNSAQYICDLDITHAFNVASSKIVLSYLTNDNMKYGFLLLSAHELCMYLQLNGLATPSQQTITTSYSVGNVSESGQIPQWLLTSPLYSYYTKSQYGYEYLMLIYPTLQASKYMSIQGETLA